MIIVPAEYLIAANRPHAPRWRVSLRTAAGDMIGDYLPITGGSLSREWAMTPRTRAQVRMPTQMVPTLIDQNLIPTGQRLRFEYAIEHFGQWVVMADLDLVKSTITRPDSVWELEAVDQSARIALDDTARGGWTEPSGTIADGIRYIVRRTFPNAEFLITGPANTQQVPANLKTDGDPWNAAVALATAAGSEVFMSGSERWCRVRPIPSVQTGANDELTVGAGGTITRYDLKSEMAYNSVALVYQSDTGADTLRVGRWTDTRPNSPVSLQRIGSHVVYRETRKANAAPSQVEADDAAAALGRRVAGRTRTPTIRHVSRPWLEPGDTIQVTYAGGPTEWQMVESVDIPLDRTNIQTTRLRTDQYEMETPK